MSPDILRSGVVLWVTREDLIFIIGILVYTDVVESHGGGEEFGKLLEVDGRERIGHTQVGDDRHGFLRDLARADVAVWSDGLSVHTPGGVVADIPCDEAVVARGVLERVFLVCLSVVPIVVEIRKSGESFLERTTFVGVHLGYALVIDLDEI